MMNLKNTGSYKVRLKILSQSRKDPEIQIARIKQTIKKVLDENIFLADRIRTLFRDQGITIVPILTSRFMTT